MCKISLIIPVYNSEKFLRKLLNSILDQTYNNYEIVIVNDGSTDDSINIIEKYMKNNRKIKCITIENSGPGIARKIGFENAIGDLLFFIDSDDFLPTNNVLEEIAKIYNNSNFDLLIFNFIRKNNNKEQIVNAFFDNNISKGLQGTAEFYNRILAGALWCKIFKREKMEKEDFCNANNYEDYYTTYKYLNKCNNFYYTDKILYYANRDNENSISKKVNVKKMNNTVELLKKTYKETSYKPIFSKIMFEYYICSRRMLDKIKCTNKEKKESIKKIKELEEYFSFFEILKFKISLKQFIKYIYYEFIDILI